MLRQHPRHLAHGTRHVKLSTSKRQKRVIVPTNRSKLDVVTLAPAEVAVEPEG